MSPEEERKLRAALREYIRRGGVPDAFSFASLAHPAFGDVSGREMQRIIDEEATADARNLYSY